MSQMKRSNSTKLPASLHASSTDELFGGDDTDFLDDFVFKTPVPLKYEQPMKTLPGIGNGSTNPDTAKTEIDGGGVGGNVSEAEVETVGNV
jgi:hypothetical protein